MTKVSVIIPVYNGREVVIDAVNSALQQQEVIEVICVNDGSTDDTEKILESIEIQSLDFITSKTRERHLLEILVLKSSRRLPCFS